MGSAANEKKRSRRLIVGLGEVLWDIFPEGKRLGGAPANFAYVCVALGERAAIASRVGRDELGEAALRALEERGLPPDWVQIDAAHPTGTVLVQLDERGDARFEITERVAWDYLEWTDRWRTLARSADAVCFGTLAQRSAPARATVRNFLRSTRDETLKVFDVNLRPPFYSREVLHESFSLADIAKLNREELRIVGDLFELDGSDEEMQARSLLDRFALQLVCVTRGAAGSLLVSARESIEHAAPRIEVVDTVGAGDAFTAVLTCLYLDRRPLALIGSIANRLAAWVATQLGAMPPLPESFLAEIADRDRFDNHEDCGSD